MRNGIASDISETIVTVGRATAWARAGTAGANARELVARDSIDDSSDRQIGASIIIWDLLERIPRICNTLVKPERNRVHQGVHPDHL